MTSVVIAAHNEESVIGRCLADLSAQRGADDLDITVVANGCVDGTAGIARSHGVRVIETEVPGKARALNLADDVAVGYPRIYLDADIRLAPSMVSNLTAALAAHPQACAAVPDRRMEDAGRPVAVRWYTTISARLPAFRDGLFGRGVIALSEAGRSRFDAFPELIADDLFLDSVYRPDEKLLVATEVVTIETPHTTRDLLRRLVRVRRGNAELRSADVDSLSPVTVRRSSRSAWLTDVVLPHPRLAPAGVVYAALTLTAAVLARWGRSSAPGWGRDESTRTPKHP